jgi:hypothetical protein
MDRTASITVPEDNRRFMMSVIVGRRTSNTVLRNLIWSDRLKVRWSDWVRGLINVR